MTNLAHAYLVTFGMVAVFACGKTSHALPDGGSHAGQSGSAGSGGAGNTGSGGSAGTGHAGNGATGGSAGKGGASGGGHAGSAGASSGCNPNCGTARECCGSSCVNLQNDPRNCGTCAHACDPGTYCAEGACVTPPCMTSCGAGQTCCAGSCCGQGQICCEDQGPVSRGALCVMPDASGTCPAGCAPLCKCTSPETRIATPSGQRRIAELRVGDFVYSVDHGALKIVPIIQTRRVPAPNHTVMHLTLATGAVLDISAGHPTIDGRSFGDLRVGDELDGVAISTMVSIPYAYDATYDILPDSDSGAYFAGGALIGSTLAQTPALVRTQIAPASIAP